MKPRWYDANITNVAKSTWVQQHRNKVDRPTLNQRLENNVDTTSILRCRRRDLLKQHWNDVVPRDVTRIHNIAMMSNNWWNWNKGFVHGEVLFNLKKLSFFCFEVCQVSQQYISYKLWIFWFLTDVSLEHVGITSNSISPRILKGKLFLDR